MSELVHLLCCMQLHICITRYRCQEYLFRHRIDSHDHVDIAPVKILLPCPSVDTCNIQIKRFRGRIDIRACTHLGIGCISYFADLCHSGIRGAEIISNGSDHNYEKRSDYYSQQPFPPFAAGKKNGCDSQQAKHDYYYEQSKIFRKYIYQYHRIKKSDGRNTHQQYKYRIRFPFRKDPAAF